MMMNTKLIPGSWIYHDFELYQVIDENSITDGFFKRTSHSLEMGVNCFKLNLENKQKSDCVKLYYDRYHNRYKKGLLGNPYWPDVRRTFEKEWIEIIKEKDRNNLQKLWRQMENKYIDVNEDL